MTQMNIFARGNRYSKLSKPGDNPGKLNAVIDWEMFRPAIETALKKDHKSKAGRRPYDFILLFKVRHCKGFSISLTTRPNIR